MIFDLVIGFEIFPPLTPTFLQLRILSLLCIPVSYHPYLSSYYLVQYPDLLRRDELLDRNRSGSSIPLLRTLFYVIKITVHIKTVDFFLFTKCEKVLKFTFWSVFLVEKHDHILKIARSVMSSFEFLHISVKLPSRVQSCWRISTH